MAETELLSGPVPGFGRGPRLPNGSDLQKLSALIGSCTAGIKAGVGGGKANAVLITTAVAEVITVTNANDSVKLPIGYSGLAIFIANAGANPCQVFGSNADTINGAATGTGVSLTNGKSALYRCVGVTGGVGRWYALVSA